MREKIIVNYVCEVNFPNSSAYGIHVLKMCDAFAKQKVIVNLFAPSILTNEFNLKNSYKIKNKINFIKIFNYKIKLNILKRVIFSLKVLNHNLINRKKYKNFFLSRSIIFSIIAALLKRNIILELHHPLSGLTKNLYYILKKFGYLNNLKYIFIHKNLIKEFTPSKSDYICLDDAVDIEDFKVKKNISIKKTCIYVGSFHPGKGIEKIFSLADKQKNINFHMYGDKKFLINNKLPNNVQIYDYIPYKKIPNILSKYEVALMPYEYTVQGRLKNINLVNYMSPMKMFDYLASSKIILASDLNVYKHILKHKYNSILIKSNELENWIFWINKIFNSKNKFNYIKKNAKKTAAKFTWDIRTIKILEFVKKNLFE